MRIGREDRNHQLAFIETCKSISEQHKIDVSMRILYCSLACSATSNAPA